MLKVKIEPGCFAPTRAHDTDAGYDLKTPICVKVEPHSSAIIDTGVHVMLPPGKCAVVISKSGLCMSFDLTSTGLVDEGFTGTIRIKVFNHGDRPYTFSRGEKISQFYITNYYAEEIVLVDEFPDTERGESGFGSTGKY